MNRTAKNIVFAVIMILTIISIVYTTNTAINNPNRVTTQTMSGDPGMGGDAPEGMEAGDMTAMGNPPDKPDGNMGMGGSATGGGQPMMRETITTINIATKYYAELAFEGLLLGVEIIILILTKFNKTSIKEAVNGVGPICIIFVLGLAFLTLTEIICFTIIGTKYDEQYGEEETNTSSELSSIGIQAGSEINLGDYMDNVKITAGGEYTLSGAFSQSIIIDTTEDVTLNLDNVVLTNTSLSSIVNASSNLTINTLEDTTNIITGNITTETSYSMQGAIFTDSNITFTGEGSLTISQESTKYPAIQSIGGNVTFESGTIIINSESSGIEQSNQEGTITVNDGSVYINVANTSFTSQNALKVNGGITYILNRSEESTTTNSFEATGGTLISIGKELLTTTENDNQKKIEVTVDTKIEKGQIISLTDAHNNPIITFKIKDAIDTIIISSQELTTGTYYLYDNCTSTGILSNGIYYGGKTTLGNKIKVNNSEYINVN